jgi:hypothetical protein
MSLQCAQRYESYYLLLMSKHDEARPNNPQGGTMADKRTIARYCASFREHCARNPGRLIAIPGPFGSCCDPPTDAGMIMRTARRAQ